MSDTSDASGRSLWREPMLWLVVGLPAAVIVAGIATLVIALRSGGSDAIPEEVRRTAQVQVADLGADARARELRFSALLRVDEQALEVLPVSGAMPRRATLSLRLQHPTQAAEDLELELMPGERGWRVKYALDRSHDWRLELAPAERDWRLRGRLPAGVLAARLDPALVE